MVGDTITGDIETQASIRNRGTFSAAVSDFLFPKVKKAIPEQLALLM